MADVYCSCTHERRQHSGWGCTWADPDGKNRCRCTVTYNELGPTGDPKKKKK